MSTTVDTLVTKYVLDGQQYKSAADAIEASTNKISGVFGAATGVLTTFAGIVSTVAGAIITLGISSGKAAADFDALVKSLIAIEGSAKVAGETLKELRKLSEGPGLEFNQSVTGYNRLRNAGINKADAIALLNQMGNANALNGGNSETFGRALLAASQIKNLERVSAEDLNQMTDAGIPIRRMMKEKYGTADTEELARKGIDATRFLRDMTAALAELPRAGDSALNVFENLNTDMHFAMVGIGDGFNNYLLPFLVTLSTAMKDLDAAGVTKEFGDTLGSIVESTLPHGITELNNMKMALIGMAAGAVMAAAALRNASENAQEMKSNWDRFWENAANSQRAPGAGEKPLPPGASSDSYVDLSPAGEAQRFIDVAMAEMRLAEKRAEKEKEKTDEEKKKKADEEQKNKASLPYLSRIAVATEKTADMMSGTIGGSVVGGREFNSVNINRLSGGGSRNARKAVQALMALGSDAVQNLADSRGVTS